MKHPLPWLALSLAAFLPAAAAQDYDPTDYDEYECVRMEIEALSIEAQLLDGRVILSRNESPEACFKYLRHVGEEGRTTPSVSCSTYLSAETLKALRIATKRADASGFSSERSTVTLFQQLPDTFHYLDPSDAQVRKLTDLLGEIAQTLKFPDVREVALTDGPTLDEGYASIGFDGSGLQLAYTQNGLRHPVGRHDVDATLRGQLAADFAEATQNGGTPAAPAKNYAPGTPLRALQFVGPERTLTYRFSNPSELPGDHLRRLVWRLAAKFEKHPVIQTTRMGHAKDGQVIDDEHGCVLAVMEPLRSLMLKLEDNLVMVQVAAEKDVPGGAVLYLLAGPRDSKWEFGDVFVVPTQGLGPEPYTTLALPRSIFPPNLVVNPPSYDLLDWEFGQANMSWTPERAETVLKPVTSTPKAGMSGALGW